MVKFKIYEVLSFTRNFIIIIIIIIIIITSCFVAAFLFCVDVFLIMSCYQKLYVCAVSVIGDSAIFADF